MTRKIGHAVGQGVGLSGAGSRHDQQMPLAVYYGLLLIFTEGTVHQCLVDRCLKRFKHGHGRFRRRRSMRVRQIIRDIGPRGRHLTRPRGLRLTRPRGLRYSRPRGRRHLRFGRQWIRFVDHPVGANVNRYLFLHLRHFVRHGIRSKRLLHLRRKFFQQGDLPVAAEAVFRVEQLDHPVISIIPREYIHLSDTHAAYALGDQGTADLRDVVFRDIKEYVELAAETRDHGLVNRIHRFGSGPDLFGLADDLGQGYHTVEVARAGGLFPLFAVGEFLHAGHDSHGHGLAAIRTQAPGGDRFPGVHPSPALPVPVIVVLALFGIELHRPGQPFVFRIGKGAVDRGIAAGSVEQGGFPAELSGRMGIGVRDQHVVVELLQPPVHERVGRKAGLDGENMLREVAVTVRYEVETSPGPQGREPGRPDVGGDEAGHRV